MIISEDILRRDTVQLIKQIDEQIAEVDDVASKQNVDLHEYRDSLGNWPIIPLLQAKAQAYNTLVMLQVKR